MKNATELHPFVLGLVKTRKPSTIITRKELIAAAADQGHDEKWTYPVLVASTKGTERGTYDLQLMLDLIDEKGEEKATKKAAKKSTKKAAKKSTKKAAKAPKTEDEVVAEILADDPDAEVLGDEGFVYEAPADEDDAIIGDGAYTDDDIADELQFLEGYEG
jgi:hypothetical protein